MLALLQREEEGADRGAYGPCLEYLLQHKLLETLYSLGRSDVSLIIIIEVLYKLCRATSGGYIAFWLL